MILRFASGGDATLARKQKDDSWCLHCGSDAEMATIRRRRTRKGQIWESLFVPYREQTVYSIEQYKDC